MQRLAQSIRRLKALSLLSVVRFRDEDGGQDVLEYALLAAFIGIAGWAVLQGLPNVMGATYASWIDPSAGVPALWNPPEPASAGS